MGVKLGNEKQKPKVQFSWVELSALARLSDSISWQNIASRSIFFPDLVDEHCYLGPEIQLT